jgi:hypothetical protein
MIGVRHGDSRFSLGSHWYGSSAHALKRRPGAGPIPPAVRSCHTVEGATLALSTGRSPCTRRYPRPRHDAVLERIDHAYPASGHAARRAAGATGGRP